MIVHVYTYQKQTKEIPASKDHEGHEMHLQVDIFEIF